MLQLSPDCVTFSPASRLCETFFDEVNQKVHMFLLNICNTLLYLQVCTVRTGGQTMAVTARGPTQDEVVSFKCVHIHITHIHVL
jgi:hypothetical protein